MLGTKASVMSSGPPETKGRAYGKELTQRPKATAQAALVPNSFSARPLADSEVAVISATAQQAGFLAGTAAAVASGGAVIAANAFSSRFRGALGLSGKLALVVTPSFGAFYLKSHLTLAAARADPEAFFQRRSSSTGAPVRVAPRQTSLALWQEAANFVYSAPFKTIVGIALPIYGAIFYKESTSAATKDMLLSQRLIHTRVYGQAVAVITTLVVMGFAESMRAEGRYRIEDGHVVRGEEGRTLRHWYSDSAQKRAQAEAVIEREYEESHGLRPELLVPFVYVPLIPLMYLGLRGKMPRDRLTQLVGGTIAVGLGHAGYVMFSDSSTLGGLGEDLKSE